jgi:hypothetical protein
MGLQDDPPEEPDLSGAGLFAGKHMMRIYWNG